MKPVPFALPEIDNLEIEEVIDCLKSGWLTTGEKTKQFENDFAQYVGVKYALAVNSATAGLHLALEAIGLEPGDKVITTPYTFTATAEVIRYLGADPIMVDIDSDTLNISPRNIRKLLRNFDAKIKAILPVHIAGQACQMDELITIAKENNLAVIEDAAHAIPSTFKNVKIGSIGDATVFSFYATKTLTTGEGGMVTTNSSMIANRIKIMRLHGINRDIWDRYTNHKSNWYYEVVAPGFKYNMSDINAAIGVQQLKKVDRFQKRRQWIANEYSKAFKDLPLKIPYVARIQDIHAWHLYIVQLKLDKIYISRNQFIEKMAELGIGTSVHFIPLHLHPYWRDRYCFNPGDFPIALKCYNSAVSLPIYSRMSDADIKKVIGAVRNLIIEYSK